MSFLDAIFGKQPTLDEVCVIVYISTQFDLGFENKICISCLCLQQIRKWKREIKREERNLERSIRGFY
jgi:hypothetical protein